MTLAVARTLGFLALLASPGCYLSHERSPADARVEAGSDAAVTAPPDAGALCRFTVTTAEQTARCTVSTGSTESCAEAAVCLCAAGEAATPSEILACAGPELTFRGALTFTDFCTASPPARMGLREALEGYLGGRGAAALLEASPECESLPALFGTRPYASCGAMASRLCACVPGCDLDAALGRSCLGLDAERADCIAGRVVAGSDCAFVAQLPAIVAACL